MKGLLTILALLVFFLLISCNSAEPVGTERSNDGRTTIESTSGSSKVVEGDQSAVVTNSKTTVKGVLFNSCLSELIDYTGVIHTTSKVKHWNGGFQELFFDIDIQGSGTGRRSGTDYVVRSGTTNSSSFIVGPPYPVSRTITIERALISKGSAENVYVVLQIKTEVDASGKVVLHSVTSSTQCR
jgi:hypothetical protein